MIVQRRRDRLRLIRQHEHALAAGALAHAWRAPAAGLPYRLVTAVGLHDVAWRELDRRPRLDPSSGRPYAFDEFPLEPKLRAYRDGLDEMEAVDPRVGLLGSLHYCSFLDERRAPEFLASERGRQARLRGLLERRAAAGAGSAAADRGPGEGNDESGRTGPEDDIERQLAWLKCFDGLSLRLCLAPPAVRDADLPPWLDRGGAVTTPRGREIGPRWRREGRVELAPAPLAAPVTLEIPVIDLPRRGYPDIDALERAWREADERVWRLTVEPGR